MRQVVGAILLAVVAIPLLILPVAILWGVQECGPVDSSCHHTPYRLVGAIVACLAGAGVGLWLVIGPRRDVPSRRSRA